jgi:hypothetical protein
MIQHFGADAIVNISDLHDIVIFYDKSIFKVNYILQIDEQEKQRNNEC